MVYTTKAKPIICELFIDVVGIKKKTKMLDNIFGLTINCCYNR